MHAMDPQRRGDIAQGGQVPEAADDGTHGTVVDILVAQNATFVLRIVQRPGATILRNDGEGKGKGRPEGDMLRCSRIILCRKIQ